MAGSGRGRRESALLLTGDGRYVELAATLQYSIDPADPEAVRRFVCDVADGETGRPAAGGIGGARRRRPAGPARPPDRRPARGRARRGPPAPGAAGAHIDSGSWCAASRFRTSTRPWRSSTPTVTSRVPRAIASGGSTRRTPIATEMLAEAKGKAAATIHRAEADRAGRAGTRGEPADAFITLADARRYAPALTDFRLFWEKVADALAGKSKLILDDEPGRRRHLVLPADPFTASPVIPLAVGAGATDQQGRALPGAPSSLDAPIGDKNP